MGRLEASLARLNDRASLAAARRLRPVLEPLTLAEIEASHLRCFGHTISKECPPYEGEYGQAHIFQKTQALADIAGFYRAFGLEPAADAHERADHISVELEFMHFLCRKEAYAQQRGHAPERIAQSREAQATFLREHLGRWAPEFARRLRAKDDRGLYGRLSELLDAYVRSELRAAGVEPAAICRLPLAHQPEDALGAGPCWTPACGIAAEKARRYEHEAD
ncbi:MAG: molecular chaperone TorD family protein [Betaproteobacteria bacterium]|nr:molecular chaperone TorD family protein [Betaproteobacteria bacterium]